MPRRELFASGVCIVQLRSTLARAELFLLAPFAPTSEPARLIAVCLFFGHVRSLVATELGRMRAYGSAGDG